MGSIRILENEVITDTYEFKKILGEGSYSAAVVLGVHKKTCQEYAIKIIDRKMLAIKDHERLNREIDINGRVDHPNIVKVFEIWKSDEEVCLVLDYMRGGELFDRITNGGPMIENDAKKCIVNILHAVQYLHSLGIAHRDLKPENLLFETESPDSELKLIDFGFAKIIHEPHVLKTPVGTTAYAAPDIARMEEYTPAVDMWSIGCILYFMLFSRPPFYSDDEELMEQLVLQGNYHFPGNIKISDEAKDLISHLIEKKPEKRYTASQALNHPWITGSKLSQITHKTKLSISSNQVKSWKYLMNKAIDLEREDDDAHNKKQSPFIFVSSTTLAEKNEKKNRMLYKEQRVGEDERKEFF